MAEILLYHKLLEFPLFLGMKHKDIMELVAQGFGITVMLDTPPVHRPDVKILPLTAPDSESHFYIARRKDLHPLSAIDRFFDFCVETSKDLSL